MTALRDMPAWTGVQAAAHAIDRVFVDSPMVRMPALDAALGCRMTLKVETLNPIRSFKGRGTDWFVRTLADTATPLVTASAGNFGQGLAYAARRVRLPLTVFASVNANPAKIRAMETLGATVTQVGEDFDAAKAEAVLHAAETGGRLVIDGDERAIAEGAGTIAYELLRQAADHDIRAVLAPLGNGALIIGLGTWLKHAAPLVEVVAVGSTGAPAMAESWRNGRAIETPHVHTIADGIAVRVPEPYALACMEETVDDVVEVTDDHILDAMKLLHQHVGLVVEPAGAAGVAAMVADPSRWHGKNVATVICGGNTDQSRAAQWLH